MTPDHYAETILIEISRMQRTALVLPADTGERYNKDGKIVQISSSTRRSGVRTERHGRDAEVSRNA